MDARIVAARSRVDRQRSAESLSDSPKLQRSGQKYPADLSIHRKRRLPRIRGLPTIGVCFRPFRWPAQEYYEVVQCSYC